MRGVLTGIITYCLQCGRSLVAILLVGGGSGGGTV